MLCGAGDVSAQKTGSMNITTRSRNYSYLRKIERVSRMQKLYNDEIRQVLGEDEKL
jgi:hypothetical protein